MVGVVCYFYRYHRQTSRLNGVYGGSKPTLTAKTTTRETVTVRHAAAVTHKSIACSSQYLFYGQQYYTR